MPRFKLLPNRGSYWDHGRRVEAGGIVIRDRREDLGANASKFEQMDPDLPDPLDAKLAAAPRPLLRARGGGWFDVLHPTTGATINKAALREDEANRIIDSWNPAAPADGANEGDEDDDPDETEGEEHTATVEAGTPPQD